MPIFIRTKFIFSTPISKGDLKDVKQSIEHADAQVSVRHKETLLSVWLKPEDCYEGTATLALNNGKVEVNYDGCFKTKMTSNHMKEIASSKLATWSTSGVDAGFIHLPIDGEDDKEIDVTIELSSKKF